jgi:hypothetical protein
MRGERFSAGPERARGFTGRGKTQDRAKSIPQGLNRLRKNALYEGHGFSRAAPSYHE